VLTIFCVNCKQNQENNKIIIDQTDQIAVCPHCQATYFVNSGIGQVVNEIQQKTIKYNIRLNNKQYQFTSHKRLAFKNGTDLTVVQLHGKVIAIADHSRQLWFPIKQTQQYRKILNYLRIVITVLLVLLSTLWLKKMIGLFEIHPFYSVSVILAIITVTTLPAVVVYRHRKKQSTIPENLRIEFDDLNHQ
jgi:hypothetical protein